MKFLIHFILILLITILVPMYSIWWYMVALATLVGFFVPYRKTFSSFVNTFLFSFMSWSGAAAFLAVPNEMLMADRVGGILNISGIALILVTGLIAGICVGFASAAGHSFRQLFKK